MRILSLSNVVYRNHSQPKKIVEGGFVHSLSLLPSQHHARPHLHNVATLHSQSLQEPLHLQLLSSPFPAMHTSAHKHFALADYKKSICILQLTGHPRSWLSESCGSPRGITTPDYHPFAFPSFCF